MCSSSKDTTAVSCCEWSEANLSYLISQPLLYSLESPTFIHIMPIETTEKLSN